MSKNINKIIMIKNNSVIISSKNNRTASIDVLKFILAFLIVVIHVPFSGHVGIIPFARIAVPLFFMITGYYLPTMKIDKFKKHIKKILVLTITSTLFYMVFSYIQSFFHYTEASTDWFTENFNFHKLYDWILYNNTPIGIHLWYFYALLYVFLILYIFYRFKHINFLFKILPLIFLFNYLLSFGPSIYYRNFLFTGLPYVLLGCLFRKHEEHLLKLFSKSRILIIGFILFTFGLGVELFFYKYFGLKTGRDLYFFNLPIAICIFLLALQHPHYGAGTYIALIGRKYSGYIYIMHPFFLILIQNILKTYVGEWIFKNMLYINLRPFFIFGITTICVMIGYKIWTLLYYKFSYFVLSKSDVKKR